MDDFRPTSSTAHHHPHPEELLSPLEQEVLDEYAKLVGNLDDVFLSLFFSFLFSIFCTFFWPLTDSKNVIMMKL